VSTPELTQLYAQLEDTLHRILTAAGHAALTDVLYGHAVTLEYERLTSDGDTCRGTARFPLRSAALRHH
jgi:hypothetical protein